MKYTIEKANAFIKENKGNVNKKHRHKYHLMPEIGWMNDPNGLIYYKGEYHAFYQHYPYESIWGPMHWGHAKSKDLYNWEHLPVALAPDLAHEHGCFSGGSVEIDNELYLLYTSHFDNGVQLQQQSIAKSIDGLVFKKDVIPFLGVEDLPNDSSKIDFRDPNPSVINGQKFILVGSTTDDNKGQFLLYKTNDFKEYQYWNKIGPNEYFGDMAECPDLFELDGKHVLLFSGTNIKQKGNRFKNVNSSLYAIGHFNSITGEYQIEHIDEIDLGHHFYAPQTILNDQKDRIMLGWMDMWQKPYYTAEANHNWTGALTFPRQLRVINNKLIQRPYNVDEIFKKEVSEESFESINKTFRMKTKIDLASETLLKFGLDDNYFSLKINKTKIELDTSKTKLYPLESRYIELNMTDDIEIELFMDVSSIEVFIKDVDKTITTLVYFDEDKIAFNILGGMENIKELRIWE